MAYGVSVTGGRYYLYRERTGRSEKGNTMSETFISNTSLEQTTDEDGTVWHLHECCVCGDRWRDRKGYGKWCSGYCYHDDNGYDE
jgi:phage/plasmid primase-like uncharacterized protein